MNVSLKWLSTLVDIKGLDAEEMAETLTIDGKRTSPSHYLFYHPHNGQSDICRHLQLFMPIYRGKRKV